MSTYAREMAHRLHPVQMATCCCDGGIRNAPGAYCEKATAIVLEVIERCAVEAADCFVNVGGDAAHIAARIRALAGAKP
jgi:hypothetical protein